MKTDNFKTDMGEYKSILSSFLSLLFRYRAFVKSFFADMDGKRKALFVVCNLILSVYIVLVFFFFHGSFGSRNIVTINSVTQAFFLIIFLFNLIIIYCKRSEKIYIPMKDEKTKIKRSTFLSYAAVCLFVLLTVFIINFPGLKSPDIESQWSQVQNFEFSNWHPVIHTFMIWLITRVCNYYAFVIFFQIIVFSCAVGYLVATLESWGLSKKYLLLLGGFIIFNPYTHAIMMYAWKDTAFTIILTFLSGHIINVYLSRGKWFIKFRNIFAFALCAGLSALMRHNGIFFTMPLLFLLFLYIKKEPRIVLAVTATLLIVFSIRFPLYSALKATYPDQVYIESVGIPMTIMGDVLIKNPSVLSPETKEFLYRIAPEEEWRLKYKPGNYNSIKFQSNASGVIIAVPVKDFFKMTFNTIKSDTSNSFYAFRDVTFVVWEIFGSPQLHSVPFRESLMADPNILRKILKTGLFCFERFLSCVPLLSWAMTKIGWQILALLLVGMISCYRNGGRSLILIVPSVMYNAGTMLLLCSSEDRRFFHFNVVISLAFIFVLLGRRDNA